MGKSGPANLWLFIYCTDLNDINVGEPVSEATLISHKQNQENKSEELFRVKATNGVNDNHTHTQSVLEREREREREKGEHESSESFVIIL